MMNFNWQKITWISLILVVLLFGLSYILGFYTKSFCYSDHYSCFEILKYGISFPLIKLLPYLFFSFIFVLFLSKRYKKVMYIFSLIITIILSIFIFNLPMTCSGVLCDDRIGNAIFFRNLYPVILIPTVLIMWIYFKIKDYKEKLNQLK